MIETSEARAKRIKAEEKVRSERAAEYARKQAEQRAAEASVKPTVSDIALPISDPNAPLTPLGAKSITKRIRDHLEGADKLILEAHDRQAWVALKYPSWEAYVKKEFEVSRSRAYQLINFVKTVELLKDAEKCLPGGLPEGERQTRPMEGLTDAQKKATWQAAKKEAKGQPTPKQVRAAVNKLTAAKAKVVEPEQPAPAANALANPAPNGTTISNGLLPPAATLNIEDPRLNLDLPIASGSVDLTASLEGIEVNAGFVIPWDYITTCREILFGGKEIE